MKNKEISFKVKTRGDTYPENKSRVYISYHPEDLGLISHFCELMLGRVDCACYWYDHSLGEPDEAVLTDMLKGMQLIIVPVTCSLLFDDQASCLAEIRYAIESNIPVLPIFHDKVSAEAYSKVFGQLQYLNEFQTGTTGLTFDKKLDDYLEKIFGDPGLGSKIREAFDAHIFLSYRKTDRRFADHLMRLIHSEPSCRDVAVWYDEFLTPGESFNQGIYDALSKCDLFVLAVTQNITKKTDNGEDNFVVRVEYPEAVKLGKPIFPAAEYRANRRELKEKFENLPEPVCVDNADAFRNELRRALSFVPLRANSSPEHDYYIGLAYLKGVGLETDHGKGIKILTEAADGGEGSAMMWLANYYHLSGYTEHDTQKGLFWQRRFVDYCEKKSREYPSDFFTDQLINARECLADWLIGSADNNDEAAALYEGNISLASSLHFASDEERVRRSVEVIEAACRFYSMSGQVKKHESCLIRALGFIESVPNNESEEIKFAKFRSLSALAEFYSLRLMPNKAKQFFNQASLIADNIKQDKDDVSLKKELAIFYNSYAHFLDMEDEPAQAVDYFDKAVANAEGISRNGAYDAVLEAQLLRDRADSCASHNLTEWAESTYVDALSILERFSEDKAHQTIIEEELSELYFSRGLLYLSDDLDDSDYTNNPLETAEECYYKALTLMRKLRAGNPAEYASDLSRLYLNLGCALFMKKNSPNTAKLLAEEGLGLMVGLSNKDQSENVRDVLSAYESAAKVYEKAGDLNQAEIHYQNARFISKQLFEADPGVELQTYIEIMNHIIAIKKQTKDYASMECCITDLLAVCERVISSAVDAETREAALTDASRIIKESMIDFYAAGLTDQLCIYANRLALFLERDAESGSIKLKLLHAENLYFAGLFLGKMNQFKNCTAYLVKAARIYEELISSRSAMRHDELYKTYDLILRACGNANAKEELIERAEHITGFYRKLDSEGPESFEKQLKKITDLACDILRKIGRNDLAYEFHLKHSAYLGNREIAVKRNAALINDAEESINKAKGQFERGEKEAAAEAASFAYNSLNEINIFLDKDVLIRTAYGFNEVFILMSKLGKNELAEECILSSIRLLERVVKNDSNFLNSLSIILHNADIFYYAQGNMQKAEEMVIRSTEAIERFYELDPGSNCHYLINKYRTTAEFYAARNMITHKNAYDQAAIAIGDELLFREGILSGARLASSYSKMGSCFGVIGNDSKAKQCYLKAIEYRDNSTEEMEYYSYDMARYYEYLFIPCFYLKQYGEAETAVMHAIAILESIPMGQLAYKELLSTCYKDMAEICRATGRAAEGDEWESKAKSIA